MNCEGQYGAHQRHVAQTGDVHPFWIGRSCAVSALVNVVHWGEVVTREEESSRLVRAFHAIRPHIWGVPTVRHFAKGLRRYDASLVPIMPLDHRKATYAHFLTVHTPVALLTVWHPNRELRYHWVVVTAFDGKQMTVSNWGTKRTYSFDDWYDRGMHKRLIALDR